MYWAPDLWISKITDIIAVNHFKKVKHYLDINNNEDQPADCTDKIRPLFNTLTIPQQAVPHIFVLFFFSMLNINTLTMDVILKIK